MNCFIYCRKSTDDKGKQVQSIEDQERILRALAKEKGLKVVEIFKESRSAKAPGRPIFDSMINRIKTGEASTLVVWRLNRLARNPICGGMISWMLQQSTIQRIVTPEREYHPTDNVLMMNVEFGMANQFVLDLGKSAVRGMRSKCEKGWFPARAPMGYLNFNQCEQGKRYIVKDEERFELVKKMWKLMLTGQYSLQKICNIANDKWGFRTRKTRSSGGVKLAISTLYQVFTNPFYYGEFDWNEETYQGKHEPMITRDEFDRVQSLLGKKGKPRVTKADFAYTGLIECGECGCSITAEKKHKYIKSTNSTKSYTYYHCTHKKKDYKCKQRSIEKKKLEERFNHFLDNMTIEEEFIDWIIDYLYVFNQNEVQDRITISDSLKKKITDCETKLDKLLELKISDLITDEEFKTKKESLTKEKNDSIAQLENVSLRQDSWIESTEKACNFIRSIKTKFNEGLNEDKRLILSILGSNFVLKDGILTLQANGIFKYLEKGIEQTKDLALKLESAKGRLQKEKSLGNLGNKNLVSIWCPGKESNLRPLA